MDKNYSCPHCSGLTSEPCVIPKQDEKENKESSLPKCIAPSHEWEYNMQIDGFNWICKHCHLKVK